ncbi:MAG: flagellin [Candidatus Bathyarchaeota archaeon]|nr:flagellin [Candidatus Bathyarchaeota archaeon]
MKSKKGIVGIEAAIVLIAFIIIAAALSYVVVNMGFYTTQKTKEAMSSGLEESLSALQLDGVVTGRTDNSSEIEYVIFPVKLSVGGAPLDLKTESVIVSVYLPNATLMNIYQGAVTTSNTTWTSLSSALNLTGDDAKFAIYNGDGDTVLETTEKAFLVIRLGTGHPIADYETVKIETKTAVGAALTVVRTAPGGMAADTFVDLG